MADYFVDATAGNDSNDGLSEGAPWKTIAKVSAASFSAGDTISFKRGEKWREQLMVPSSGSSGNPITFGAYGTGDDPVISGADDITGAAYKWTASGSGANEFYLEAVVGGDPSLGDGPDQIYMDGVRLLIGTAGSLSDHEWDWADNDTLGFSTVYLRDESGDPDGSGVVIEASVREAGIRSGGKSYLTIDGLTVERANLHGVYFLGVASSNLTVQNCTTKECHRGGIVFDSTLAAQTVLLVDACTVHDNGGSGVNVFDDFGDLIVQNCTVYNNCTSIADFTAGIKTFSLAGARSNGITIKINTVYDNGEGAPGEERGYGIWVDSPGTDVIIERNLCYGNQKFGIQFEFGAADQSGRRISYNICRDNTGGGILVARRTHDCLVYNNTCVDNIGFGNIAILGESGGDPVGMEDNIILNNICWGGTKSLNAQGGAENDGVNGDNNLYQGNLFGPDQSNGIRWGGDFYSTLAAWVTAVGAAATGNINDDPLFADEGGNDFHLQPTPTSPAIDAGTDVSLTQDFDGVSVPRGGGVDLGAFEYSGMNSEGARYTRPADLREQEYKSFEANALVIDGTTTLLAAPAVKEGKWKVHRVTLMNPIADAAGTLSLEGANGRVLYKINLDAVFAVTISFGDFPWGFNLDAKEALQAVIAGTTTVAVSISGYATK